MARGKRTIAGKRSGAKAPQPAAEPAAADAARTSLARLPLRSPVAGINHVIANIVMLAAGRLLRDRMEQGLLNNSSDPVKAERRGGGRGFATSAALWGASRLARRSPLGLAVVVGGLAAKLFYDRGKRLEAGRPRRKQARKTPGSES